MIGGALHMNNQVELVRDIVSALPHQAYDLFKAALLFQRFNSTYNPNPPKKTTAAGTI